MKHMIAASLAAALAACGGGTDQIRANAAAPPLPPAAAPASTPATVGSSPVAFAAPISERLDRSNSLGGPDKDSNGVRDDVDEWISAQPFTATQRQAMTQAAQALQLALLVDATDRKAALAVADKDSAAMDCVYAAFEPKSPEPNRLLGQLEALTANTEARTRQYLLYNHALSGTVFTIPAKPICK